MKKIVAVGLTLLLFGSSCWAADTSQNELLKALAAERAQKARAKPQQAPNTPQPAPHFGPVAAPSVPFAGVRTFADGAAVEHAKRAARTRKAESSGKSRVLGGGPRTLADVAADEAAAARAASHELTLAITNYLENKRLRIGGAVAYSALAVGLWLLIRAQVISQLRLQQAAKNPTAIQSSRVNSCWGTGYRLGSSSDGQSTPCSGRQQPISAINWLLYS